MNTSEWISRNVSKLLPAHATKKNRAAVPADIAQDAPKDVAPVTRSDFRSTQERLNATLRREDEALSPRMLRRTLQELHAVIDPSISEVEGGRRAKALAAWYLRNPGQTQGYVAVDE